jgi:hypothetical protein
MNFIFTTSMHWNFNLQKFRIAEPIFPFSPELPVFLAEPAQSVVVFPPTFPILVVLTSHSEF